MKLLFLSAIFFSTLFSNQNTILNETLPLEKTKEYYEKDQELLEEVPKLEKKSKKNNKIDIDGSVDVNKENKSVDGVNVNIGSKF